MPLARTAGPSGRRPRTKPIRDNTGVAGLCSEAEASAAISKGGGSGNPFKSFLRECDCLDAEELLAEVGIERISDLLELDAELLAILELPDDVQYRLMSAIQIARSSGDLEDLDTQNSAGLVAATEVSSPVTAAEVEPVEVTDEEPVAPPPPPRPLQRQESLAARPELEAATITETLELHRQASDDLKEEIVSLQQRLSRVSVKNLLRRQRSSTARLERAPSAQTSSALPSAAAQAATKSAQHRATLSRSASSKKATAAAAVDVSTAAPSSNATAAATIAPSMETTRGSSTKAQQTPACSDGTVDRAGDAGGKGGGISARIAALRQKEAAEALAAGEAAAASSRRAAPVPKRVGVQTAISAPAELSAMQAQGFEASWGASRVGQAASNGANSQDGIRSQRQQAAKAMFERGGAQVDTVAAVSSSAKPAVRRGNHAELIARFEAKRAELAAARQKSIPHATVERAPPAGRNAKAAFFEDMAAKQQAQAAAPSGPPVPTQREQAMKAFGANFRKA